LQKGYTSCREPWTTPPHRDKINYTPQTKNRTELFEKHTDRYTFTHDKYSDMPRAEQTKALIIEKTAPLFNMKGFAGTTLSDMEKATGLTKGSIYNNFTDKNEVALAVFDHQVNMVNALISVEMSKHHSTKDQLLSYVKVYGNDMLRHSFPAGGCPILNTAVESDDTHPGLRKKASAAIIAWKDKIVTLIQKGIKNREFRPAVNAEEVALTIVATIEGAIMISRATGKLNHLKAIMRSVEKMIHDLE
jgi:TetR/AcrR family transcriptional regulator, transcriptional repressor for nem operon